MLIDVPIKIPYTTHPHMIRYDGDVFNKNPNSQLIDAKHRELEIWGDELYGIVNDNLTRELISLACDITNKKETDDIVQFALNFEEDVAIMHNGILQAICFCFPSSWIPKTRVGYSLTDIHKHVADGEKLSSSSQRIAKTMTEDNCYKRHVWTICSDNELNQHPLKIKKNFIPTSIKDLYLRVETQTTKPLKNNLSSLFFVKVDVYSLSDVFKNNELKNNIIQSINSMSESVLTYKNLKHIKYFLTKINN